MPSRKIRLDVALVERGLAASRERARALIMAGHVRVDDRPVTKAGTAVGGHARIEVVEPDHPYVSRGGVKLAHALDALGVNPAGRHALDVGASTGGFTDVLLQRGAAGVIALDVGRAQIDWRLRSDPRVTVVEGVNARSLTRADVPEHVDLVTIDVSFISLGHILPALAPLVPPGADIVALVKPQFEAGREQVGKHGLVSDPAVHEQVIQQVTEHAAATGLTRIAMTPSALKGATGNQEFFLHLRRGS